MARHYTKEQVLEAINGSVGIILTVSKRLDCTWETAKNWVNRWEETRVAFASETEKILDVAEGQVFKAVQNGDITTAKWILSRKGKHRGWNEDNTLKLANGDPLNITLGGEMLTREQIEAAGNVEIPNYEEDPADE